MQTLSVPELCHGVGRNRAHAAFINIAHGINRHAALTQTLALTGVEITHTDHHHILRLQGRLRSADRHQFRITVAEQNSQRHAMDILRW